MSTVNAQKLQNNRAALQVIDEELDSVNKERLEQERLLAASGGIIGPESRRTASTSANFFHDLSEKDEKT